MQQLIHGLARVGRHSLEKIPVELDIEITVIGFYTYFRGGFVCHFSIERIAHHAGGIAECNAGELKLEAHSADFSCGIFQCIQ